MAAEKQFNFTRLLVTFMISSLLPIILSSAIFYQRYSQEVQERNREINEKILGYGRDKIDSMMENIEGSADFTHLMQDVNYFSFNSYLADPNRFNRMTEIVQNICSLDDKIAFITVVYDRFEYFFYFGDSGSNHLQGREVSGTSLIEFSEPEAAGFLARLESSRDNAPLYKDNRGNEYFLVYKPLLSNSRKKLGAIYYAISAETVKNLLNETLLSNPLYVEISDGKGRVLIAEGEYPGEEDRKYASLLDTTVTSSRNGWTYRTVYPVSSYLSSVRFMRNLLFIIFLIFVLILSISSLLVSRRLYNSFEKITESNSQMERFLERFRPTMENAFLNRLIRGSLKSEEEIRELLEYYHLNFPYPLYSCIIIQWRLLEGMPEREGWSQLITEEVKNTLSAEKLWAVSFTNQIDEVVIVMNHTEELSVHQAGKDMLKQVSQVLNKNISCVLTGGCGLPVESPEKLDLSRRQARQALSYSFTGGLDRLYLYSGEGNMGDQPGISINTVRLANAVLSEDRKKADREMTLLPASRRKVTGNPDFLKTQILICATELVDELNIDELRRDIMGDFGLISKLYETRTLSEGKEWFRSTVYSMIEKIARLRERGQDRSRINTLTAFMEENYTRDISLTDIAEAAGLNPNYATTLFSEVMGMGIVDYLNRFRIDKCKEILLQRDVSLSEVAGMIGYNNTQSLSRYFNKYEGISPGKWKENRTGSLK